MRVQLQDSDGGVSVAKGTRWYGEQGELRGTEDCYSFSSEIVTNLAICSWEW